MTSGQVCKHAGAKAALFFNWSGTNILKCMKHYLLLFTCSGVSVKLSRFVEPPTWTCMQPCLLFTWSGMNASRLMVKAALSSLLGRWESHCPGVSVQTAPHRILLFAKVYSITLYIMLCYHERFCCSEHVACRLIL